MKMKIIKKVIVLFLTLALVGCIKEVENKNEINTVNKVEKNESKESETSFQNNENKVEKIEEKPDIKKEEETPKQEKKSKNQGIIKLSDNENEIKIESSNATNGIATLYYNENGVYLSILTTDVPKGQKIYPDEIGSEDIDVLDEIENYSSINKSNSPVGFKVVREIYLVNIDNKNQGFVIQLKLDGKLYAVFCYYNNNARSFYSELLGDYSIWDDNAPSIKNIEVKDNKLIELDYGPDIKSDYNVKKYNITKDKYGNVFAQEI
jgi:lipoprotein